MTVAFDHHYQYTPSLYTRLLNTAALRPASGAGCVLSTPGCVLCALVATVSVRCQMLSPRPQGLRFSANLCNCYLLMLWIYVHECRRSSQLLRLKSQPVLLLLSRQSDRTVTDGLNIASIDARIKRIKRISCRGGAYSAPLSSTEYTVIMQMPDGRNTLKCTQLHRRHAQGRGRPDLAIPLLHAFGNCMRLFSMHSSKIRSHSFLPVTS